MTTKTKQTLGEFGCGWIAIISMIWMTHSLYTHNGTYLIFAFTLFLSAGWAGIICKKLNI